MATLRSYGAKVGNRGAAREPTMETTWGLVVPGVGGGKLGTVVGIFGGVD